ncbi:MAG: site-specific integrase [Treponema sp.]|nr:site-specific integrase [Treponema sp.]
MAADWIKNGIPKRKRGKAPKNLKPRTLTLEAIAGLTEVLKYCKTGDIEESGALEIAQALKSRGLLSIGITSAAQGRQSLIKFLFSFWDHEKSEYLRDKRAHGKDVTKRYCIESTRKIKRNWQPFFGDMLLSEITRKNLKEFGIALFEQGLASATVNNELSIGITALKWAFHEKLIPEDITAELMGFSGDEKKRDIFTQDEAMKLLDTDTCWKEIRDDRNENSEKAYIAALVAGTSALRSGEIRSLRREDIGEDVLYVRHNYNNFDGLKKPKNNEEQPVYLLPKVRTLLLALLDKTPHTGIDPAKQFVFWSADPEKPISAQTVLKYFHSAVKRAEIDISERKLDLHSLRHYVATSWANETGDLRQVAKVTRHKDLKQAARYSDHTFEREVAEMGKTAANILSFAKDA